MANKTFVHKQTNKLTTLLFLVGVVLLIVVFWAWLHYVRNDPVRTFYGAINNNLQTLGLSKQITQDAAGQSLSQDVELTLNPQHIARAETTISENGETSTTVKTESISTPRQDYVRYSAIETEQKSMTTGEVLNFSDLLGVWGKTEVADKSQTNGELYGESVLGVVPVGDLSAKDREELINYIKSNQVYEFDESKVERKVENGRPVYTYKVKVSAEAWVGMLKKFADMVGLTQLEALDPSSYREAQSIDLTMKVDVWSRHITELIYAGDERRERIGSYGVRRDISVPEETIPIEELQQKLQAVQ